jgi:hypothetical protein
VELAAVVVVPSNEDLLAEDLTALEAVEPRCSAISGNSRPLHSSRVPILGNDVLRSWMDRVRTLGIRKLWLTSSSGEKNAGAELVRFARQGVDRLLMIKLKSYAEMDLVDLLRFHRDSRNSVTEARDHRGHLGVSLLDRTALHMAGSKYETCDATRITGRPYQFGGYAKRIFSAKERQELVGDVLTGACAMRPSGTEIREQVWIGEGASLADSVRVVGPTYIGARTIVRAGATLGPFASVERDCVVDCGTSVEQSTVLPNTYLAPGLLIRKALVDGSQLEDLCSGIVADLQPAGLGGRIEPQMSRKAGYGIVSDIFAPTASGPGWGLATSSGAQPWIQVQL